MKSKLLFILCLFTLFGCSTIQKEPFHDQYLAMTFTHVTDDENRFEMDTYMYDFETKEAQLISELNYNAQYPLSYYDKENHLVYYTRREGESHYDEVYEYNPQTKEEKKLTDGVYAVNAMMKTGKNELTLVAVTDNRLLHLCHINLETLKIEEVYKDQFTIAAEYYDPIRQKIIVAGYDEEEEYKITTQYNSELIDKISFDIFIYEYDLSSHTYKEVCTFEDSSYEITSIIGNEEFIYYYEYDSTTLLNKKVIKYDRKSKTEEEIDFINADRLYGLVAISQDSQNIIFIDDKARGDSSLKIVDVNTKEDLNLFHENIEGQINNAFLGKQ